MLTKSDIKNMEAVRKQNLLDSVDEATREVAERLLADGGAELDRMLIDAVSVGNRYRKIADVPSHYITVTIWGILWGILTLGFCFFDSFYWDGVLFRVQGPMAGVCKALRDRGLRVRIYDSRYFGSHIEARWQPIEFR